MTENRHLSEAELETLFQAAAANAPLPSDELLARVMADADKEADAQSAATPIWNTSKPRPAFTRIFGAIGGWPAVAGLVTATVVGVWIGYASPDTLGGLADGYLVSETDYDLGDLMPTFDDLLGEG